MLNGLNRLLKNPYAFSSDALAGNAVDISNPQYLIRESKILSKKADADGIQILHNYSSGI